MFSTTIKRSVASLGVVAGLLAAAIPASAQIGPGTIGVTTPHPGSKAPAGVQGGGADFTKLVDQAPAVTMLDYQGSPLLLDVVLAPW